MVLRINEELLVKKSGLKYVLFCLVLFFATVHSKAQYNSSFLNYNATGRSVSANLDFEAGSNGMSSKLVDKLVMGGHIDNNLKKESSKHLKAYNNFGIILNYDL